MIFVLSQMYLSSNKNHYFRTELLIQICICSISMACLPRINIFRPTVAVRFCADFLFAQRNNLEAFVGNLESAA